MSRTAQEAYEATNPDLPQEAREKAAAEILAGIAANDAYLNSRGEIEKAVALAQGGRIAAPHAEREAQAEAENQVQAHDALTTAVEVGTEIDKVAKEAFPGEEAALRERLKELTGGVL